MSTSAENETNDTQEVQRGFNAVKNHVLENKITFLLWISRFAVLVLFFVYLFLDSSPMSGNSYHKILLANAAISSLRLHQRLQTFVFSFSAEFLSRLYNEDSAHYLLYSFIFLNSNPVTIFLVPIVTFALLHFASFSVILLDLAGRNNMLGARYMISLVDFQYVNLLKFAATSEICIMPYSVFLLLTGKIGLMTPFIYYRFMTMRYTSRRNPYTRQTFYEMRILIENQVQSPNCPQIIRNLILRAVNTLSSLGYSAPPTPPS